MNIDLLNRIALTPALALLPAAMDTPEARHMLLTIALQESALVHRHQHGGGPAVGFWQFEDAGVKAVIRHQATRPHALTVLNILQYPENPYSVHLAVQHNDVLAAAFARLLLWALPQELPAIDDPVMGWDQYMAAWRPGRPHPEKWPANWSAVGKVALT